MEITRKVDSFIQITLNASFRQSTKMATDSVCTASKQQSVIGI